MRLRRTAALLSLWLLCTPALAGHNLLLSDPVAGTPILDEEGRTIPIRWDDRALPIKWWVHSGGSPASQISAQQVADAMDVGFLEWENVETSRIAFQFAGFTSQSNGNAGFDGINLVTFADEEEFPWGDTSILAFTPSFVLTEDTVLDASNPLGLPAGLYPRGTILDADIIFNPRRAFSLIGTDLDVRSIGCHEIGHLFGLSHSPISAGGAPNTSGYARATMYPFVSFSQLSLEEDDKSGAAFYYPDPGSGAHPGGQAPFTRGAIAGRVTEPSGRGLSGAMLIALPVDIGLYPIFTLSDWDGSYLLPNVLPGRYKLQLSPFSTTNSQGLWNLRYNPLTFSALTYGYPTEFYSIPETGDDPLDAAEIISVTAGTTTTGIDLVANVLAPLADDFEPNDTSATAAPIAPASLPIGRTLIDPFDDQDWFRFTVPAGTRLTLNVDAESIQSTLDSHLFLFEDRAGVLSLVAENDDEFPGVTLDSAINLYVTAWSGPHLVLVRSYQEDGRPTSRGQYQLAVAAVYPTPTPTPTFTPTSTPTWTPTPTPTGTPTPNKFDLVRDARVDELDLLEFLRRYETGDVSVDFTGDGRVDREDLLLFSQQWSPGEN